MNIIIHRGSKKIGGSCIEISSGSSRIILDIGQELPDIDSETHQKISVLPKVKGLYKGDKKTIDAVLISHGHGDHGRKKKATDYFVENTQSWEDSCYGGFNKSYKR